MLRHHIPLRQLSIGQLALGIGELQVGDVGHLDLVGAVADGQVHLGVPRHGLVGRRILLEHGVLGRAIGGERGDELEVIVGGLRLGFELRTEVNIAVLKR